MPETRAGLSPRRGWRAESDQRRATAILDEQRPSVDLVPSRSRHLHLSLRRRPEPGDRGAELILGSALRLGMFPRRLRFTAGGIDDLAAVR